MRVFGWASDTGGCGNYRIGMPMWAMGQLGHEAVAGTELDLAATGELDLLVGQRIVAEPASSWWQSTARDPGRTFAMVLELDDDLLNVDPASPFAGAYNDPETRARLRDNIALSDAVTVSTEHLAEVVSAFNRNVHVLPNCIDRSLLAEPRTGAGDPVLGWAGGGGHEKDFRVVQEPLSTFLRKNRQVQTLFVGHNFGPLVGRPSSPHDPGSSNLLDYVRRFDFDFGIAPLAATEFNRSKSDVKLLEYAARSIPAVASAVGPYAASIEHGVTGLLAERRQDWSTQLRAMAFDVDLRTELAVSAHRWAESRTIQNNAWRWDEALSSVVSSAPASAGRAVAAAG